MTYAYDTASRLTDVTEDGAAVSHYGYDADDNRTTFTGSSGTVNPDLVGSAPRCEPSVQLRMPKKSARRICSTRSDAVGILGLQPSPWQVSQM